MDVKSLYITDNDFEQKIKELKVMLRLRMNGETSVQMKRRNLHYTINYGVSLPHVKEIASRMTFTPEECRKLWLMNIRETMLLACMQMPADRATTDEMCAWAEKISTPDMAEQASFFLFGRLDNASQIASRVVEGTSNYALATSCFTVGRALQLGKSPEVDVVRRLFVVLMSRREYNGAELRGMSLLLRQCVRKAEVCGVDVEVVVGHLRRFDMPEVQSVVYEVEMEREV